MEGIRRIDAADLVRRSEDDVSEKNLAVTIRDARPMDQAQLRRAVVEIQEYEGKLHSTRLPGEQIADAYLTRIENQIGEDGALLIAEIDRCFVGFVAGWIERSDVIAETPDSSRFGYISDLCVMPDYRGQRIARRLLSAIEERLSRAGITRIRICSLAANASARASYEHAGFEPYEITYEKSVARS
jgi:ribosomal protein S18 acetylase RimI-like enzyme